jgi:hypothetical protein
MAARMKDNPEILLSHEWTLSAGYFFVTASNIFDQFQSSGVARCYSFRGKQHPAPLFSSACSKESENLQYHSKEDIL